MARLCCARAGAEATPISAQTLMASRAAARAPPRAVRPRRRPTIDPMRSSCDKTASGIPLHVWCREHHVMSSAMPATAPARTAHEPRSREARLVAEGTRARWPGSLARDWRNRFARSLTEAARPPSFRRRRSRWGRTPSRPCSRRSCRTRRTVPRRRLDHRKNLVIPSARRRRPGVPQGAHPAPRPPKCSRRPGTASRSPAG